MARKAIFKHATQVNTSTYPDDGTSPVGSNEWNEAPDAQGMLGFSPTTATITIASGVATVTDTVTVVAAESGTSDTLDKLAITNTSQYDLIYLFADTGDTITLTNTSSPSASGHIKTVSDVNETLSSTTPTILIRKGNYWYGYGGGVVNAVSDIGDVTISSIGSGELLKWNGSTWINQTLAETGIAAASHTQAASTITDFDTEVANNTAVAANTAKVTYPTADSNKLAGIEASATADQTDAEIVAAVEAGTDSNTFTDADHSKLNAIEASADVTDATNVNAAGAAMLSDTTTAGMGFVIDEDAMGSNLATKVPTQQSVKAYVDTAVASNVTLKGSYNASTNSPDLDTSPSGVVAGDHYVVSVAGTFFSESLQAGDSIIAQQDNPTTFAHWVTVNNNMVTPIVEANIADNAITLAKMAAGTDGNLISYDTNGDPVAVATGTATHVLTSNGAGAAPTFQAAAGGGATIVHAFTNTTTTTYTGTASSFGSVGVGDRDIYIKKIDANNEGVFTKIWKNGVAVEVQIA